MTNSILSKLSHHQIDGLVEDCSNSIANTLELLQSCTKTLKCWFNIDKNKKNSNQLKSFFDLFSKCPWLLSSNDMPFSWSWHSLHQHFFQGEICQTLKFCEIVIFNNILPPIGENYIIWCTCWLHLLMKSCLTLKSIVFIINSPDSKVHWANMGLTWGLSAPGGPHVGPMNLAIRVCFCHVLRHQQAQYWPYSSPIHIPTGPALEVLKAEAVLDFISITAHKKVTLCHFSSGP